MISNSRAQVRARFLVGDVATPSSSPDSARSGDTYQAKRTQGDAEPRAESRGDDDLRRRALNAASDRELRFEVDGANAARDFLRGHGVSETDVETVWNAIALHTTPGIPELMRAEIALVQAGAGMDVTGRGGDQFTDEQRAAISSAFPRGADFPHAIIDAFYDGMKHRPDSTFGTFNDDVLAFKDPSFQRVDICRHILAAPAS